ncbi:unnamed protein product [Agarophyton chilense]
MLPYMQVCVAAKLLVTVFELYVSLRQHRRFHPHQRPSKRLAPIVPLDKFHKSQTYCRAKSTFDIVTTIIDACLSTLLTLSFVNPRFWQFSSRFSAGSELRQTLVFAAVTTLFSTVIDLPASIYKTFILEAKYGFNRTTVGTFVADMMKGLLLSVVLGAPILTLLFYVLRYFSVYSPLTIAFGLWITLSVIVVSMLFVYPLVIAPMFNKFDPLPEGDLKQKLTALAQRLKFPLDKMYVIDGSRRSSHSNAYIFGLTKKYICIYDSLLEQTKHEDDQVVSILCHELGHWKYSHLLLGVVISLTQIFVTCVLYGITSGNEDLFLSFGYTNGMPLVIGLMLFNELLSPIDSLLSPLQNMLSRRFEYQADAFAKEQGMEKKLGDALVTISVSNLSNMSPDPLYSAWNYSHPTLLERLDALNVTPEPVEPKKDQ